LGPDRFLTGNGLQNYLRREVSAFVANGGPAPVTGATVSDLFRWGNNGLVFRTGNGQVVLVNSPIVPPALCYANCDGSTAPPVLNVLDFTCFLQRFASADPYANCDGSTAVPVLNVLDFSCFLQKFAAGCN